MLLRKFSSKLENKKKIQFYKVIITAPDGRFGVKILEGGLDKTTAEFEEKRYKDLGMIVSIHREEQN